MRRVQDVAEVEAHHGAAAEGVAGGHGDPGAGRRVEVRDQAAGHRAIEELREKTRERSLQVAEVRPEPRHGSGEEVPPEDRATSAGASA